MGAGTGFTQAGAGGSSASVYKVLMKQSGGADAPSATVVENTVGPIVWTRNSTGDYSGTLAGTFILGKTYIAGASIYWDNYALAIPIINNSAVLKGYMIINIPSPDYINIVVKNEAGVATELGTLIGADGIIGLPAVEVYP